jgi:hypothetical protein
MEDHKKEKLEKKVCFQCQTCQTAYHLLETHIGQNNKCLANCLKKWREIVEDFHQKEELLASFKEEKAKGNFLENDEE